MARLVTNAERRTWINRPGWLRRHDCQHD